MFQKTKKGIAICPYFIWTSEDIEGLGQTEDDVNLVYCTHPLNPNDNEGNCQSLTCPIVNPPVEVR